MKRLFSVMLALFLAAFTGSSLVVASEAEDYPAQVTIVTSDIREDGTFDVQIYVKDNTPFGFTDFGIQLDWNAAKIEPITKMVNRNPVAIQVSALSRLLSLASGSQTCDASFASQTVDEIQGQETVNSYVHAIDPGRNCKIAFRSDDFGFGFGKAYIEKRLGAQAADYGYHETYGFLFGSAQFKVREDVSGSANFSASIYTALRADNDTAKPTYTQVQSSCLSDQVEIDLCHGAENMKLEALQGASIRYAEPVGLRFTCKLTADDFSQISEFGTVITRGNDSLKIPAEVMVSGDPEKGGEVVYTGVLSYIKPSHYSTNFTAKAYAVIHGVTIYSDSEYTANIKEVAQAALNDNKVVFDKEQYAQAMAVLRALAGS